MSVYRTSVPEPEATHTLLCRACGSVVRAGGEPDVTCRACRLAQPALRDEEAASIAATELVSFEIAGHNELNAFGASIGAPLCAAQLTLRCDGVEIAVSLHLDSGLAVGVDLEARTGGLPPIVLRRETDTDVDAKAAGVAREVQTGDGVFDRAVYIESDAPDEDILRVLSAPAVRRAIVRSLGEHGTLRIGDAAVSLPGDRGAPGCFEPARLNERLAALRVIAGAPRPLAPAAARRWGANLVGLLVVPPGLGALLWSAHAFPPLDAEGIGGLGLAAGLVVAAAAQPLVTRLLRGRSTSHRDMLTARIASFLGVPALVVASLLFANGALDRSPEVEHHAAVVSLVHDEEYRQTTVHAGEHRGLRVEVCVEDRGGAVKVGDAVTVWSRGGALGVPWHTRPSEIDTARGTLRAD